jgi:1,4-dihydroxy-2-naphthoate octaprenyltransferase
MTPWIAASRPATLSAAIVPVAVGSACAHAIGAFRIDAALAALFGAIFIQIGTNFVNDAADADRGADVERLGPARAVSSGVITRSAMWRAAFAAFGIASLCGVYLIPIAGWLIVPIGVASIASGIAYTAGPYPLAYHGLGDVFVLAFFGFTAVAGTTFAHAGYVPPIAWAASIPIGAIATAILVVNNLRDRDGDARANKRTLAVRFGKKAAIAEYFALLAIAFLVPALLSMWLPLVTAPLAIWLAHRVATRDGRALNIALAGTAALLLLFGVTFALALAGVV